MKEYTGKETMESTILYSNEDIGGGTLNLKKIKIGIKPYEYEDCGCGCGENGDTIFVDGVSIGDIPFSFSNDVLIAVLSHLGYDVEIECLDEEGEIVYSY